MTKLDNRHKILLCLLGLFLIISVWQAYTLSKNRSMSHNKSNSVELNRQANFLNNTASNQPLSKTEYSQLVRQYQVAQIQRLIAENYAAIAQARESTMRSMVQTAYLQDEDKGKTSSTATDAPVLDVTQPYSLIYTGQDQNGTWAATLKKGNQTFDVRIGSQLPDGSTVSSIDVDGVMLVNANQKKMVTFSGVIQIKDTSPDLNVFPDSTQTNQNYSDHSISQNNTSPMAVNTGSTQTLTNTANVTNAPTPANNSSHFTSTTAATITSQVHATNRAKESMDFVMGKMRDFSEIFSFEYQTFFPKIHHLATKIFHPYAVQEPVKTIKPVAAVKPPVAIVPAPTAEDVAASRALLEELTAFPSVTEAMNSDSSSQTSATQTSSAQASTAQTNAAQTSSLQHAKAAQTKASVKSSQVSSVQKTEKVHTAAIKTKEAISLANEVDLKKMSEENTRDYTILLTENKKLGDIETLIKKAQLGNAAKYAEIINNEGNKFYVLTYGKYVRLADAESALQKVSTKLKGNDAFITTFADIKNKEKRSDEPGVIVIK
jgi:septal ring-binding cell division protein DamX